MRAKLDSFFHDIGYRLKIANDTKKLLDKRLASSFSLFPYIAPNENRISEIIRDLLDPNGNHGQGNIFLQKFLEVIDKSDIYEIGDQVDIRTEEPTTSIENDKRRIDILIEIKRNDQAHAGVAIENKPWAIDQGSQIDDYFRHIKARYQNNHYIIYLTPDGRKPPPHSAKKTQDNHVDKLICMSYQTDIASWLNACYKESQADYVRQFLFDFSKYCQYNLDYDLMTNDKTEIQTISSYILEAGVTNRIKTAALISNNFAEIKKNIIISFSDKLSKEMKKKLSGYTIDSTLETSYLQHGAELTLSKENWPFTIKINNQKNNNLFFLIGVSPISQIAKGGIVINEIKKTMIDNIIYPEMTKNYKQGRNDNWWFHCSRCDKFECWTQPETLAALHENPQEAIDYFVEEFGKILAIVEPLIDKHPKVLTTCQPAG